MKTLAQTLIATIINNGIFKELLLTSPTVQPYKFLNYGGHICVEGQIDDQVTLFRIKPKKCDGGDTAGIVIVGKDIAGDLVNLECLVMIYSPLLDYRIYSSNAGTGAVRKLRLAAGSANIGQLDLETNGNVTMSKSLTVTQTVQAATLRGTYLTYSYSDPEIEGWKPTTREKVKEFARKVFAYEDGVINFFNSETRAFEIFDPASGHFYCDKKLSDLQIVEKCDPIKNTDVMTVHEFDSLTGSVEKKQVPLYSNICKVPDNKVINPETGNIEDVTTVKGKDIQ